MVPQPHAPILHSDAAICSELRRNDRCIDNPMYLCIPKLCDIGAQIAMIDLCGTPFGIYREMLLPFSPSNLVRNFARRLYETIGRPLEPYLTLSRCCLKINHSSEQPSLHTRVHASVERLHLHPPLRLLSICLTQRLLLQ